MKKGFTLIELLIVIGILAVLATVTVLVLNPAELFRQARDSQRLSDLGSIRGAVGLYITTVASPSLSGGGLTCGTNFGASIPLSTGSASSTFTGLTIANNADATIYRTNGNGWVSVDFGSMPGGSPLSILPHDPRNALGNGGDRINGGFYYSYACDSTNPTFVLKANMESTRYSTGGTDDVESTDGGPDNARYETGTYPNLSI